MEKTQQILGLLSTLKVGQPAPELPRLLSELVAERTTVAPSTLIASPPKTGTHRTWANQIKNQVVQPLQLFYPTTLNEPSDAQNLVSILARALEGGTTVKAAGSGHSYSDVATTPGFFIDTHGLNKIASTQKPIAGQLSAQMLTSSLPLSLGPLTWGTYDPENNRALVELEAGVTIHDLNLQLEHRNLGLANMGGYDGQTMMGAISTSTHGSGISLPPFPDMVRSLVLLTTGTWNGTTISGGTQSGVNAYRIEPSAGITNPATYNDPLIGLIQDDDCFNATICNMGCFGVVYSLVLEVMQMYWLEENRSLTTLDKILELLAPNSNNTNALPSKLTDIRNLEVLVHPYPMNGMTVIEMDLTKPPETYYPHFKCLLTERTIVPKPDSIGRSGHRNFIAQLLSQLSISFELLVDVLNAWPEFVPYAIDLALSGLVDSNYINSSFNIYNLGLNENAGFAAEIGFALQESGGKYTSDNFKAAVDSIHATAQRSRVLGAQYQTSPFSLRFVKNSQATLSMMHEMDTCMIEMDMITGTYAGPEVMMRYQDSAYVLGGRPHWGLEFDNLSGSNDLIGTMYPKLATWKKVYDQFNKLGTFNNSFTDRVGFTNHQFIR